jgi:hypothetical protein
MAERHLTVRRQVAASRDSVWDVFADFPNLADHWAGSKALDRSEAKPAVSVRAAGST